MPHMMIHDCDMYYEEHGTGQQTVLFLHGVFFSSRMFHQQMIALRDRYRCVLLDLRGHGQSSSPPAGYDLASLASDVMQFIDVKRYGQCHIIGASLGGIVGMRMAIERPELVKSLTLLGTTADESPAGNKRFLKSMALRVKLFGPRFARPTLMKTLFSPGYLKDPSHKEIVAHWRQEFLRIDRQSLSRIITAMATRERLYERLYKLRKPVLIIGGELDRASTPDVINRLHNGITGSRLLMLPETGHAANLEKPGIVNEAILKFLQSINSTPPHS